MFSNNRNLLQKCCLVLRNNNNNGGGVGVGVGGVAVVEQQQKQQSQQQFIIRNYHHYLFKTQRPTLHNNNHVGVGGGGGNGSYYDYHNPSSFHNLIPQQPNTTTTTTTTTASSSSFRRYFSNNKETTTNNETNEEIGKDEAETKGDGDGEGEEKTEIEVLEGQVQTYKDQLLRSLAEQENIRRIAKKDIENARSYAVTSFAKSLLDTSDNLTRALDAVPEEYRDDRTNHSVLATLYEGIRMTDDGLTKALTKNGLEKFGIKGDKFDPNLHEALYEYPDETLEPGTVGQVMKVGFTLNKRVIRPAEVGVTKKP